MNNTKLLYSSKYPFVAYLCCVLFFLAIFYFSYHIIFGEMPILSGIVYTIISLLGIEIMFCSHSGKVELTNNALTVTYFFPWYENTTYKFRKIKNIETSSFLKYRPYSIVYFEDDKDNKYSFKITTNNGFGQGIEKLEDIIKSKYGLY
ncbi:hypothetical protein L3049_20985 [Labilibaculum sp. DW002]|uniref:PH domain-containing protein n=1 Tax=Paralabilibaculum antarcticum TaxID=2912572 RepID=A0ABT5VYI5_9BACT|nr:hypothetical protein [Labilibaculum sp. DW002]MDE5420474.1 hypothetical protein [Labilibaculum sp. DW002]